MWFSFICLGVEHSLVLRLLEDSPKQLFILKTPLSLLDLCVLFCVNF